MLYLTVILKNMKMEKCSFLNNKKLKNSGYFFFK